jgi:hypothetical protein
VDRNPPQREFALSGFSEPEFTMDNEVLSTEISADRTIILN